MPLTVADTFTGFSAQALKFLRDLKKNNDRAWFAERKEICERECLAPLRALPRWREAMASDPKRFQNVLRALQRNRRYR